jgi:hypothetical protein
VWPGFLNLEIDMSKEQNKIIKRAESFLSGKSVDNSFKIITALIDEVKRLEKANERR